MKRYAERVELCWRQAKAYWWLYRLDILSRVALILLAFTLGWHVGKWDLRQELSDRLDLALEINAMTAETLEEARGYRDQFEILRDQIAEEAAKWGLEPLSFQDRG